MIRDIDLAQIESIIGYAFVNKELLATAFTHSSYANENKIESYQRLEYLGDSFLNFVVGKALFDKFRDKDEGFLSKARAKIVSERTLSMVITQLELIDFIRAGEGSIVAELKNSTSVQSDLFESIIGAMLIDAPNFEIPTKFIKDKLQSYINADYNSENVTDYKSKLLELCSQKNLKIEFFTDKNAANADILEFKTIVIIEQKAITNAVGTSKKKAEQTASKFIITNSLI